MCVGDNVSCRIGLVPPTTVHTAAAQLGRCLGIKYKSGTIYVAAHNHQRKSHEMVK